MTESLTLQRYSRPALRTRLRESAGTGRDSARFLRPIRGGVLRGASRPRVPLRSTRGYSPLPLAGQKKNSVVVLIRAT